MRHRLAGLAGAAGLALTLGACGPELPPLPQVEGPACAVVDAETFAREPGRLKAHSFNDFTFWRRSGHGSCKAYENAALCYLSAPKLLHVSHKGQDWWFEPGVGERVILTVSEGRARCLIDRVQTTGEWAGKHLQPTCESSRIKVCP